MPTKVLDLYKLLKNKFRANKLIKNLLGTEQIQYIQHAFTTTTHPF